MNLYESIKSSIKEADASGMTITQFAKSLRGGEIDMDVTDTEIDMLVALVYNFNEEPTDYYNKFIKLLCDKTKVDKLNPHGFGGEPILVCKFSDVFKPYNEECKDIFDMDYSEFGEDEAYYEAVVNLEPLISGNAGESTYKDMYDLLLGKYQITDMKESESTLAEKQRKIFNKYRDEFDSINDVQDITDQLNKLYDEGGMDKVDKNFFLPSASEEYKKDLKSLIINNNKENTKNNDL